MIQEKFMPAASNTLIVTRAARQVGAILKYVDRTSTTPTSYAYYM